MINTIIKYQVYGRFIFEGLKTVLAVIDVFFTVHEVIIPVLRCTTTSQPASFAYHISLLRL